MVIQMDVMDRYLSIQDLFWRTMHGYVGLLEQQRGHRDDEFIVDLKSACSDVLKAHAIGEYNDAFIPLNKNTIPNDKLEKIKEEYKLVFDYLIKNETGKTTHKELEAILKTLDSLMMELKEIRKLNKLNYK